jgi:hypothetical protein
MESERFMKESGVILSQNGDVRNFKVGGASDHLRYILHFGATSYIAT